MISRSTIPTGTPGRLIQLDVLRGIAIGLVLLEHRPNTPKGPPGWIDGLIAPISAALWTGVDLFFVLSGYLVGGLLISELRKSGRIDLKRFWIRRGFKIWPSYYLYLAVLAIVTALFYVNHSVPGAQRMGLLINAIKLFYLQNYFPFNRPPYVEQVLGTHTWSLAVEEHFYIILPLLLVVSARWWRVTLPAAAFVLLVVCLGLRLRNFHKPMDWVYHYAPTHIRIDSLFFGAFLSYLSHEHPAAIRWVARRRVLVGVVGLMLVLPMCVFALSTPFVKTFGFTLLALGYGCLLLVFVTTEVGEGVAGRLLASRAARALAWIGVWSYSIYLWHNEIRHLVGYLSFRWQSPPSVATGSASTTVLGAIPWRDAWVVLYLAVSLSLAVFMGWLIGTADARDARSPLPLPDPDGRRLGLAFRLAGGRGPRTLTGRTASSRRAGPRPPPGSAEPAPSMPGPR